jgi:formylglycine-generating enzyme required for sulfatase activity
MNKWVSIGLLSHFLVLILAGSVLGQQKIAFVAGVEKYRNDGFQPLDFAETDATELKTELELLGFKVTSVIGPAATTSGLRDKLNNFINQTKKLSSKDIVVVYFSGHGLMKKVQRKALSGKVEDVDESFLCPVNAKASDERTLISLNDLLSRLEKQSGSFRNLVWLDACRENSAKAKGIDGSGFKRISGKLSLFLAAQPGARSYESAKLQHGIFTHYLLEGLRGNAADNYSQEITSASITDYVSNRMTMESKELPDFTAVEPQKPNLLGKLDGSLVLGTVKAKRDKAIASDPLPNDGMDAKKDSFAGSKVGELRSDNGLGMKLVWLPAGRFVMGSPPTEMDRGYGETQVEVELSHGFWIGQTEVTQSQWKTIMGTSPWLGSKYVQEGENIAASYINRADAIEFAQKLTQQERQSGSLPADWEYRLTTEAQWEYACRAGKTSAYCFGEDAEQLGEFAWYSKNASKLGDSRAREVGKKRPNDWGIYDMHGNVQEWCFDVFAGMLPGGTDPMVTKGDQGFTDCVIRGGTTGAATWACRSAFRGQNAPSYRNYDLGFRVALVRTNR